MWVIRIILLALVVICFLAFITYNVDTGQKVDVNLIYAAYLDVPLITVVFWSFLVGAFASLILMIVSYLKLSFDLQSANRKIKALESEAAILRNRPIEEAAGLFNQSQVPPDRPLFREGK